jgi:hypothetical protein
MSCVCNELNINENNNISVSYHNPSFAESYGEWLNLLRADICNMPGLWKRNMPAAGRL